MGTRQECAPRSRNCQADERNIAARLSWRVFGLAQLRLLAAALNGLVPQVAVLARGAVVPLVGHHGGAEQGWLHLGTLLLPALLQPHARPTISENHGSHLPLSAGFCGGIRACKEELGVRICITS